MSVSIYCQAHINGDDQQLSVKDILNSFGTFVKNITLNGFDVVYDEMNSSHVSIDQENTTCSNFSVNRPCGEKRLYEAIYNCMNLGNVICYTSDGDKFLVINTATIDHIPTDMKNVINSEACQLITAHSGKELYDKMFYA